MTIAKQIQRQRNRKYKNLRKLRKARDVASSVLRRGHEPWTTSKVLARLMFVTKAEVALSSRDLALVIHSEMSKRRPARPPSIPVTKRK